jgi:stage II sporulation protein D
MTQARFLRVGVLLFAGRGRRWGLAMLMAVATIVPTALNQTAAQAASVELRVAIADGSSVKVGSSTNAVISDGANKLGEIAAMNAFVAQPDQGSVALDKWKGQQIWIEPSEGGYVWIGDHWFRGRVRVVPTAKGVQAINHVDLEQYLYSVLGKEMGKDWPVETLKAQAVAARSYALYQRQRAGQSVSDLGNNQGWQVYEGIADESLGTQTAVNSTVGQVLTSNGQIIEAVFHSSAGKCTENVEDVWIQALPYLRSVPDFDTNSPVATWRGTFTRDQLSARISGVGDVLSFTPEKQTLCGRIQSIRVTGTKGSRSMSGEALQSALGLKSTLFTITPSKSATVEGAPAATEAGSDKAQPTASKTIVTEFAVVGHGFGHGLGLSQYGALALTQKGYNYQQILLHYYKNTTLAKIDVK